MKNIKLSLLLLLLSTLSFAQDKNPGFGINSNTTICNRFSFSSDTHVDLLVKQILEHAGVVNHSYVIRGCKDVDGCFAAVMDNTQYIIYKPDYLHSVKKYSFESSSLPKDKKDWQALTILAHEVGHLINSHFYKNREDITRWEKELQADEFAGRIIYLMNGTVEQALSVYYNEALVNEEGDMEHPPRAERIKRVKEGYANIERYFKKRKAKEVIKIDNDEIVNNISYDSTLIDKSICESFGDDGEKVGYAERGVIKILTRICDAANMKNRFIAVPCDGIANVNAAVKNNKPYLLYNPSFLKGLTDLNNIDNPYWMIMTVLAHEIGHHFYFHFMNPDPNLNQIAMELEADEFAGFVLYRLGATLAQAQAVMYKTNVPLTDSYTHPGRAKRLAAIKKGYDKAKKM